MKISVQSVNFNISNDLVDYIEKKVNNLEKFHDHIIGAEVYLKVQSTSEKENKLVDVKMNLPGVDIVAKKQSKTFEEAASLAIDSVKRQLVKRKEKLRA
ncbi:ribosome-associated translation inhibitor RaiA [Lutimonas halocynthiae]|uniref:ribosome hibernation-promoting factor, HPF/YfiA family n=1 Tax=Lutimonas halocynthiae TaxID=1446477 RepID=UPI0025B588FB|nr:ribosome-associated translation inhibitor RaiA [Lutimonas halocynthiae]MDN3642462.1 ribosome-associated translation inhibitor RaiA [Lutimonas halocynthiae]